MNRKGTDSARLSLSFEKWPAPDRKLWLIACDPGDVFDEGGRASRWAELTRFGRMRAYGYWLTFLDRSSELDPASNPADRVTPGQVQRYVAVLQARYASKSVCNLIDGLHAILRVFAPERDWSWLRRLGNRLHAIARPERLIDSRLRPAGELFDEGIRRAHAAEQAVHLEPMVQAVAYRDGLMVALLAACPLRRRSFIMLTIGDHVVRHRDGGFAIRLEPRDVKNGIHLDFPLPPEIGTLLDRYIDVFRRRLAGSSTSERLWMTRRGRAMSINQISGRIKHLTGQWLGAPMSMHLFRHAAATSMAIDAPERAHLIAGLLGHATLRTAERHYNKARAVEAAKGYHQTIRELRRTFKSERPTVR